MKFTIDSDIDKEVEVKLRLSRDNNGMVYLYANNTPIMGFKDGCYCLYSDAQHVDGLKLDYNFIKRES